MKVGKVIKIKAVEVNRLLFLIGVLWLPVLLLSCSDENDIRAWRDGFFPYAGQSEGDGPDRPVQQDEGGRKGHGRFYVQLHGQPGLGAWFPKGCPRRLPAYQ